MLCWQGHADLRVSGQCSLGLTRPGGGLEAVEPQLIAEVLGAHAPSKGGRLELIVLNGCLSEALGRAILAEGIPTVVCWKTLVHDKASRVFGRAFYQSVAELSSPTMDDYAEAFDKAKLAVLTYPRKASSPGAISTTMFEFADPQHVGTQLPNGKIVAGVPLLLQ